MISRSVSERYFLIKTATNTDVTVFVAVLNITKLAFGNVIRFIYVHVINTCFTKATLIE
jgi:hypothetical protein